MNEYRCLIIKIEYLLVRVSVFIFIYFIFVSSFIEKFNKSYIRSCC